jgi:hypothetical protein
MSSFATPIHVAETPSIIGSGNSNCIITHDTQYYRRPGGGGGNGQTPNKPKFKYVMFLRKYKQFFFVDMTFPQKVCF